jgi:hypothetical protein
MPVIDHVTPVALVPDTVAVKLCVWPSATCALAGETVTATEPVEVELPVPLRATCVPAKLLVITLSEAE